MLTKHIFWGEKAREKLLEGVIKLDEVVSSSLGPRGGNSIIEKKYSAPMITNDGVTIARHFRLEDKTADLAAQSIINAAMKTNYRVGDGTTTTVAIACAIVKKCFSEIGGLGIVNDPISMSVEIAKSAKKAVEILKLKAIPFTKEVLHNIVSTSLRDVDYADALTNMMEVIGENGYISVDDNWLTQDETVFETVTGMKFLGSYISGYMVTTPRGEAVQEDVSVFLTNHQIEHLNVLNPLFEDLKKLGKTKVVVIAGNYARHALIALSASAKRVKDGDINIMSVLGVKSPALVPDEFKDIEAYTGAKFASDENYKTLADFFAKNKNGSYLGNVKRIVVDKDDVVISGGAGDITARLMVLEAEQTSEKDMMFKEKRAKRIASLTSGVGIVRVGAPTEPERLYIKLKLEDAVCAAKAAREEGYVKGGGITLKEIAEELGEDNILYEPLMNPYTRIGVEDVPDTVIDPVKVLRYAIENACSVAGKLITVYSTNADENKTMWSELEDKVFPRDRQSDARDNENVDLGAGRLVE